MNFDDFLRAAAPPLDLAWRKYRRRAARHRVQERLRELDLPDYAAYLKRLRTDPMEASQLADRMRITVTRFFREREQWQTLAETVLPQIVGPLISPDPLRAWSAGCAGGEEPYTLALLWRTVIEPRYPGRRLRILATDIDAESLARARAAAYRAASLREVPASIREEYFRQKGEIWRLTPEVAATVELREHNLMQEPPPGTFDLVCCRYLAFTYYRGERRREAARRLRQALRPGGVLMLGRREKLGEGATFFRPWPEAPGFFSPTPE